MRCVTNLTGDYSRHIIIVVHIEEQDYAAVRWAAKVWRSENAADEMML